MSTMVAHLKIADFNAWKPGFEAMESHRNNAGITNPRIFKSEDNKEVIIAFEVADEAKAKAMFGSDIVRDAMKKGGVIGPPMVGSLA